MRNKRQRVGAYALIQESDKILLCRLSKKVPQWEGYWTLPGGGIEFGESPEEAMIREVYEETGLVVEPREVALISNVHNVRGDEEFHGIRIIYTVKLVGGFLKNEIDGTTNLCAWHELYALDQIQLVDLSVDAIGYLLSHKPNQSLEVTQLAGASSAPQL